MDLRMVFQAPFNKINKNSKTTYAMFCEKHNIPLYAGSTVKLGFYQKPYILRDGVTYGSSLKLVGVQVVSVKGEAGVDTGDLDANEVAELFGKSSGYKAADPNIVPAFEDAAPSSVEDDDEDF